MIRRLFVVVLAVVGALGGAPAAAHEGAGTIEVLSAEPTAGDGRTYRVRVVFVADGHPAPEATVTATIADRPGAVPVAFAATAEVGVYEGTVRFPGPGDWTVRLTSLRPIASVERTDTVARRVQDAPTTSAPLASTTTTARADVDEEDDGADGTSAATTAAVIVAGVVVLAGVGVAAARRRRSSAG